MCAQATARKDLAPSIRHLHRRIQPILMNASEHINGKVWRMKSTTRAPLGRNCRPSHCIAFVCHRRTASKDNARTGCVTSSQSGIIRRAVRYVTFLAIGSNKEKQAFHVQAHSQYSSRTWAPRPEQNWMHRRNWCPPKLFVLINKEEGSFLRHPGDVGGIGSGIRHIWSRKDHSSWWQVTKPPA